MAVLSSAVEARIRSALTDRLGESGMITRYYHHNDVVYLEVVGRIGLERTARSVEQGLDSIGAFLRSEKITVDVTISSPWQPHWQSQEAGRAAGTDDDGGCVSARRR